ncbi:cation:proton antiporter [Marinobacterium arenosum]|uniref:cation:proton antiporter n=1 Tax=Marinobacterium arenosum TaxID=2862496 RepID=UPI001C960F39|nr:cation:proton antiporter [Marinobacterium arenosum]MBY4675034.1 cation:proton antiporter [Marinobacterium arenosum]
MHETLLLVLGLIGLLTIASLLLPIANRINFPYTVLLALAGSLLGALVMARGEMPAGGLLGDFLHALDALDITSEVVFFVFLPALIFESALNINARHLMADIGPILLLAVLGLLISTLLVGLTIWPLTGVGLVACLLIGAIVSATDPIAVIAIFKNLGAPKRLTILVEGESLFNDATAIVTFTILAAILLGSGEADPLSATGRFLLVFCGGILVGLVSAWLTAALIGRLRNLPLVEITLTICLAYLSFLLAEHYLHVSGVMAVVTAGLVINSFGRTQVSPQTWHALTETWEELVFWANSLIFFLVGLLVPRVMADFTAGHALALVALTLAAFIARALVLYLLLPALNRIGLGQQISLPFRTVMLWGGLRGAVSLALSLVILETPGIAAEIKILVASLVTGFVLFTLFVNAPTMGLMMRLFGLDQLPAAEQAIRNRVMALSMSQISSDLVRAAQADQIGSQITEQLTDDYRQRLQAIETTLSQAGQLPDPVMQQVGLSALTNYERQLYLERFNEGLDSSRITRTLLAQADDLLDGLKSDGVEGYLEVVERQLGFGRLLRMSLQLQRKTAITRPLALQLANRFAVLHASEMVLHRLRGHCRDKMPALLSDSLAHQLDEMLDGRLGRTRQALDALRLQYPGYAETLQKRHLARVALRLEEANYRRMLNERMISQEVFNDLMRDLGKRSRTLDRQPRLDLGLQPARLVARVPFFADLGAQRIGEIARLLKPRLVVPDERVISQGEAGDAMYFISSGALEVSTRPQPVRLGSGDFFGELALLTQQPRSADVTALAYCQLLVLAVGDFHQLLARQPDLQRRITHIAAERLQPDTLLSKVPLFSGLDERHRQQIAKLLTPYLAAPGEPVVSKGAVGDCMYFIAGGNVEVQLEPEPVRLGPGDFFGELALLTEQPRDADVISSGYCQLLVLPVQGFQQLMANEPEIEALINREARRRLAQEPNGRNS